MKYSPDDSANGKQGGSTIVEIFSTLIYLTVIWVLLDHQCQEDKCFVDFVVIPPLVRETIKVQLQRPCDPTTLFHMSVDKWFVTVINMAQSCSVVTAIEIC